MRDYYIHVQYIHMNSKLPAARMYVYTRIYTSAFSHMHKCLMRRHNGTQDTCMHAHIHKYVDTRTRTPDRT